MKVDIAQLLKTLGREDRLKEPYEYKFDNEEGFKLVAPVQFDIKIIGLNDGVLVTGNISTEVELNCSRCGKKYIQLLDFLIEEEYKLPHLVISKKDLFDEEVVFEIEDEKYIDLTEAVRQGIIVNLPIKSFCTEGCGVFKRSEAEKTVDPRLSKLGELKNKIKK